MGHDGDGHGLSFLMTFTMRRRILLAGLGAPVLTLAGCNDDTTPKATQYDTAFRRLFAQYHMVGALASVRVPGEPEWKAALGYANLASATPSDFAGHYPIRSVTKSYTVTLVLQLVRDKLLSLDDRLDTYVAGIPNGVSITLAQLAGMTSGIADYSSNPKFLQAFAGDFGRPFTQEELVAYAIPGSPRFDPGAQYEYSNTNTVLLGMIVEQRLGTTLAQALQARIFTPLGLIGTTYPYVTALPDPHPSPYEVKLATGAPELLPDLNPTSLAGSGAMVSTLDDMQTWAAALGDGRLIGAALQIERVERSRVVTNGPTYDRYGLGLGILHGWWGHTGDGLGFQLATFYDPHTSSTIAVMVNSTPDGTAPPGLNFAEEIFKVLEAIATA